MPPLEVEHFSNKFGPLAQLVERFYGIEEVTSSNLVRSTKNGPRSSKTERSQALLNLLGSTKRSKANLGPMVERYNAAFALLRSEFNSR